MIKNYLLTSFRIFNAFSTRKMIEPEIFTTDKVDDYFLVKSATYEFLINKLPEIHEVYRH